MNSLARGGVVVGGAGVIASLQQLYALVSDPNYIILLWVALHNPSHDDPQHTVARLAATTLGLVVSILIAVAAAFLYDTKTAPVAPKGL